MKHDILNDEKIKELINAAHIERSEMFHSIIKNSYSELKNLVLKPVTASPNYSVTRH